MRKVIAAEFITLDGFIADKNSKMDFFTSSNVEEMHQEMVNQQNGWDTLLMGRITYQTLAGFWPNSPDQNEPIASFMNNVPKIVVSKTLNDVPWGKWNNATLIKENISEEIQKLKREKGKGIAILGSANLIQNLINKGLVDEYFLLVYPIVLGNGKLLFKDIETKQNLKLLESATLKSGIVKLRYGMQ